MCGAPVLWVRQGVRLQSGLDCVERIVDLKEEVNGTREEVNGMRDEVNGTRGDGRNA
jgi:hypothetical protein